MEELTESARQCLVSQGIVVGSLSIIISLGLSIIGVLVTTKNNDILHFISLYQLAVLEIACGICSLLVVLYVWWVVAGYRNRQLVVRSKYLDEKMSKGLVALILPVILTFAAFVVGVIFLMIKTESSSTYELRSAMLLYGKDYTRKIIIDKLQSTLKCCGSQGIEDWFTVDWQNSEFLAEPHCGNELDCLSRGSSWDSVPFSCCSLESPPPCIHHELKSLGMESLYPSGCAEKLDEAVFIFVLLAVILFFTSTSLMAILLYSARKLQTSARSAICKGDATAPGAWWLLSSPGYNCRRKSTSDCLPLLVRTSTNDSQTSLKCNSNHAECKSKVKKIVTPALFFQKSTPYKSGDEESSEEWPGINCEASHSTSNSSLFTMTVANNAFLASRQAVPDSAAAHVNMPHYSESKARPLYRT